MQCLNHSVVPEELIATNMTIALLFWYPFGIMAYLHRSDCTLVCLQVIQLIVYLCSYGSKDKKKNWWPKIDKIIYSICIPLHWTGISFILCKDLFKKKPTNQPPLKHHFPLKTLSYCKRALRPCSTADWCTSCVHQQHLDLPYALCSSKSVLIKTVS